MVMGCQPSRLVFTGLPFEASRPGAGGTLLHLRPNKALRASLPAPASSHAGASLHPLTLRLPPSDADGGMNSSRNRTSLVFGRGISIKPCSRVLPNAT